jgi:hypothetical protein
MRRLLRLTTAVSPMLLFIEELKRQTRVRRDAGV